MQNHFEYGTLYLDSRLQVVKVLIFFNFILEHLYNYFS